MEHSVLEQALRAIEASDRRIMQLLTLRRQLASRLARVAPGQAGAANLEDRVAAVVSRLSRGNSGPLDDQDLRALFGTVIRLTELLDEARAARNGAAKKG
jgi:chorismate mutase